MFIPTTTEELVKLGWKKLDVIIITGDTYIDSSYNGAAVIGQYLIIEGYKVGIIAQPDINGDHDITRLGEPALFWGVTSGSVDSMVSNYTALKKRRMQDDLTPGGWNTKRPDRALIAYSNLIRKYYKNTVPIVLGGIGASLRRIAHYDYWSDSLRRSILFDAKADILVYGMGEKSTKELAENLKNKKDVFDIKGICYKSNNINKEYIELPSFKEVKENKDSFIKMFHLFYNHNNHFSKGLFQKHDDKFLIQTPPCSPISINELDSVYNLPYERRVHPYYQKLGEVRALNTIQFSITTHRGCYGECNFCSIALHQGKTIISRSKQSIIKEVKSFLNHPDFKGIINDIGGPTANMYSTSCDKYFDKRACLKKGCLNPTQCKNLSVDHEKQIDLLNSIKNINGIKKAFVASGIRYDLIINDKKSGVKYLKNLMKNHISGQMKIAPEHSNENILLLMRKPSNKFLLEFINLYNNLKKKLGIKQFLTSYFIAAHPGCDILEMKQLNSFIKNNLRLRPEQVQIFTPLPSTYSTLMYYTGLDPFSGKKIFVEKDRNKKQKQKEIIINE